MQYSIELHDILLMYCQCSREKIATAIATPTATQQGHLKEHTNIKIAYFQSSD